MTSPQVMQSSAASRLALFELATWHLSSPNTQDGAGGWWKEQPDDAAGSMHKKNSSLQMSHFVSRGGRRNLVDWDAVIRLQPSNKGRLRRTTWSSRGRMRRSCGGQPSVAFAAIDESGEPSTAESRAQLMRACTRARNFQWQQASSRASPPMSPVSAGVRWTPVLFTKARRAGSSISREACSSSIHERGARDGSRTDAANARGLRFHQVPAGRDIRRTRVLARDTGDKEAAPRLLLDGPPKQQHAARNDETSSMHTRPANARGQPCCVAPIIGEQVRSRRRYFVQRMLAAASVMSLLGNR
ncbi:hypothetical protein M409DRAFT_53530 [Zasmidium cellare ATCC 36951]|uniref:Uncharacterized protein n=1 Tax=Zasmidium cellare ATCC 36951 TaxID=1080233 RepID=A0A6A6CNL3_ZASCE|nr:uncharacterized protein M409DRAFT_53530 [Zasmidium cellare ATCC 36951]KAF2168233.1 hypothetical protein M409DRAFT_53530 [Zasmidium cellare ATCC 36951]